MSAVPSSMHYYAELIESYATLVIYIELYNSYGPIYCQLILQGYGCQPLPVSLAMSFYYSAVQFTHDAMG